MDNILKVIKNKIEIPHIIIPASAMGRSRKDDPLQKFKFLISIPGLPAGMGFSKCSGLKREIGAVEYRESGYDHTHKLIGIEKVNPVTLERGMYIDSSLEDQYKAVVAGQDTRTTITVTQMTPDGQPARSWNLAEAWINKWETDNFDAKSSDPQVEKLSIEFEYFLV
jgi:phage tail-like protein